VPRVPHLDLLTSAVVCERLSIDRSTLSRWVAAKKITPALKLDGPRGPFLFYPADVDRLAAELAAREREQIA
jgi:predicted site-specific integrase-resolvase